MEFRIIFQTGEIERALVALESLVEETDEGREAFYERLEQVRADAQPARVAIERRDGRLSCLVGRISTREGTKAQPDRLERPVMPEMEPLPEGQRPVSDDEAAAASPTRVYR